MGVMMTVMVVEKIMMIVFGIVMISQSLCVFLACTGVLGTISRMAKMCALRLTPTKLYFILTDNTAVGGVSIWCELTQVHCLAQTIS